MSDMKAGKQRRLRRGQRSSWAPKVGEDVEPPSYNYADGVSPAEKGDVMSTGVETAHAEKADLRAALPDLRAAPAASAAALSFVAVRDASLPIRSLAPSKADLLRAEEQSLAAKVDAVARERTSLQRKHQEMCALAAHYFRATADLEDKLEASLCDATYWLQKLEIKRGEIAKET